MIPRAHVHAKAKLVLLIVCFVLFSVAATSVEIRADGIAGGQRIPTSQQQYLAPSTNTRHQQSHEAEINDAGQYVHTDEFQSIQSNTLPAMIDALDVMQEQYFEVWAGLWPEAIDWTSAVLGTFVSAALSTLSRAFDYTVTSGATLSELQKEHENLVNKYFTQLVSSYFGQDAFGLRTQAYDDMLWVVLGWLEGIKFINLHSELHYGSLQDDAGQADGMHNSWYGTQFIPGFAHRARIFWDLASQGWDTSLCNGGMIWSPYLAPYKNAITNELFITASISMYLYFPGDDNDSPFIATDSQNRSAKPHDPKYLAAAVHAYHWLVQSNMTDPRGLYIDGYHVSGNHNQQNGSKRNTRCDVRNDMVYTYNQGVLLSGQRGLWEATGARSYLEDGHILIANVINATGYDLKHQRLFKDENLGHLQLGQWHGLGRSGILEEACDAEGSCSQDAQTFKGIFMHHLTLFCAPLPPHLIEPGETFDVRAFHRLKVWHSNSCAAYGNWITHNARAALTTKSQDGQYGMWWGAPEDGRKLAAIPTDTVPAGAVDYRNLGVPEAATWRDTGNAQASFELDHEAPIAVEGVWRGDPNDRGRGRTVETQGGGVAVLRALWEIVDMKSGYDGDGHGSI